MANGTVHARVRRVARVRCVACACACQVNAHRTYIRSSHLMFFSEFLRLSTLYEDSFHFSNALQG